MQLRLHSGSRVLAHRNTLKLSPVWLLPNSIAAKALAVPENHSWPRQPRTSGAEDAMAIPLLASTHPTNTARCKRKRRVNQHFIEALHNTSWVAMATSKIHASSMTMRKEKGAVSDFRSALLTKNAPGLGLVLHVLDVSHLFGPPERPRPVVGIKREKRHAVWRRRPPCHKRLSHVLP